MRRDKFARQLQNLVLEAVHRTRLSQRQEGRFGAHKGIGKGAKGIVGGQRVLGDLATKVGDFLRKQLHMCV